MSSIDEEKNCIVLLREISESCGQGVLDTLENDLNISTDVQGFTRMIQYINNILPSFGEPQVEYSVTDEISCLIVLAKQFKLLLTNLS